MNEKLKNKKTKIKTKLTDIMMTPRYKRLSHLARSAMIPPKVGR